MTPNCCRRRRRQAAPLASGALCAIVLAGCQTYQPAPLDLPAHRAAFESRLGDAEPIAEFARRLRTQGAEAPERFDPADGLTRAEGEVLALFFNADLRLARLRAGAAQATAENAGLFDDPVFGFDGADILSPSGEPFQYGLTLGLTIPISGRLGVEKDRASAAHEAELARLVDAEWRTRAAVRTAWASWSAQREKAQLLGEILGQIESISTITDRLERGGEISRVESRLFRVELANRRAALAQARLEAESARLRLCELLGIPGDAATELIPSLSPETPATTGDAIATITERNTALAIRRAEYRTAEETLRLEIRKQFPDLKIGGGYGSEDNDDRLLLGASIPIPILSGNRAGIAEARAGRELARASAEATLERLLRSHQLAQLTLESAASQRQQYEDAVVPMLEEQFSEIQRIAELGEVDSFLLLETVGRRFDAKSRLLSLRVAEVHAAARIAELLGPETPRSPAPVAPTDEQAAANAEGTP